MTDHYFYISLYIEITTMHEKSCKKIPNMYCDSYFHQNLMDCSLTNSPIFYKTCS